MYSLLRPVLVLIVIAFQGACCLAQSSQVWDSLAASQIVAQVYDDKYDQAIEQLDRIRSTYEDGMLPPQYIKLLIDVGAAFNDKGDYGAAQQYSFMALGLATQEGLEALQAEVLIDIGYSYYFLEQLEKGLEYGERALLLTEKLKLAKLNATAHNLLGILHAKSKHDNEIIMDHYSKALAIRSSQKDMRGVASTISNIALQLERNQKYEEALAMQKRSLQIDDSLNNLYGASWSHQMIGELLVKMSRYSEANISLNSAEVLAHKLHAREVLLQTYKTRSKLLSDQNKFKEALDFSNRYNSLRDSIYSAGLTSKVTLLQQSFEMRERDRQIAKQQASLEMQQRFFILIAIAVGLVLWLVLFYYRSNKKTLSLNKEIIERNEEIQAQAEELTEANQVLHELNVQIAEQKEELQTSAEELTESHQTILNLNEKLNSDIEVKSQELYRTNQELVKHNNELLQFSFTVSHNLRGPVARMLGLMNVINLNPSENEKEHLMQLLQKSTIELDTVLKDLNLIIDSRNNLFKVREKIFLEDEWKKSLFLLHDYIKPDFRLSTDFANQPYIFSVRGMVQNVLYNLLSNAIKYRSFERPLQVSVNAYHRDRETKLIIQDNGLGIDLVKHSDNLFKLYKRFHMHVAGKGLGLYLVKTQMEALGGKIEVQSELNIGTTFTITFPDVVNIDAQIILENEAAKLYFDAYINNTVIIWKRNISSQEYHEVFENVLQTLRTYNTPAWIADLRNQGIVPEADQQWFMKTVLPQAVECGLKRIGTIGFLDPIRQQYYQNMVRKTGELGIELRVFESLEEAKAWMAGYLSEALA